VPPTPKSNLNTPLRPASSCQERALAKPGHRAFDLLMLPGSSDRAGIASLLNRRANSRPSVPISSWNCSLQPITSAPLKPKCRNTSTAVYGWAGSSILKIDKLRFTDQGNLLKSCKHLPPYLENQSYQTLPSTWNGSNKSNLGILIKGDRTYHLQHRDRTQEPDYENVSCRSSH